MAFLASQCRYRMLLSRLLLTRQSLVPQKTPDRNVTIRSQKFPEYSLLYDFDKIQSVGRVNRTKMQATLFYACGLPVLFVSQALFGFITPETVSSFAFYGGLVTVLLHSIGFLFNDAIGYIYIKDDNNTVKISHVGYWGERIDTDITIDGIHAFSDVSSRLDSPWYHKVRLINSKKSYKIYLSSGKILDKEIFDSIFGKVHS